MKRILALFLIAALLSGMLAIPAAAAGTSTYTALAQMIQKEGTKSHNPDPMVFPDSYYIQLSISGGDLKYRTFHISRDTFVTDYI